MVDLSSTVRRGHPIAFGIFALLAFIVAVISSAVVASFNSNEQPKDNLVRDSTRFLIFAGWWGFLFSIVYVRISVFWEQYTNLFRSVFSCPVLVVSSRLLLRTPSLSSSPGSSGSLVPLLSRLPLATPTAATPPRAFPSARLSVPFAPLAGLAGTYFTQCAAS